MSVSARSGSRWMFIGLAAFFVAGLAMLTGGLFSGWSTTKFIRGSSKASGRLLRYETSRSDDGGTSSFPVVEFESKAGRVVEFRSQVGGSSRPYGIGQPIEVLYDPHDPDRAE